MLSLLQTQSKHQPLGGRDRTSPCDATIKVEINNFGLSRKMTEQFHISNRHKKNVSHVNHTQRGRIQELRTLRLHQC
jgi:hypothetical protein